MRKIISRGPKADDLVTERFLGIQRDFLGRLGKKEEQKQKSGLVREGKHSVGPG